MKLLDTILAFTVMTGAASASYTITGTSIDIGGNTYANGSLSGVNLGTFMTTDSLILDGSAPFPIFQADVVEGGSTPVGAGSNNNYIHVPHSDGATLRVIIDGSTVVTTALALSLDPGSDKGTFGWGNDNLADIDLIAAAGGVVGAHTVSYEIDYTFSYWDSINGINVQVATQTHEPLLTGSGSFTIANVPEPSSTALLGLGGLALILRRRR